MEKILEKLKSKWLRNTGMTILLIAIIIAIFIGINIGLQKWDPKDIDLTKEQIYSLTDASREKISSLPEQDKMEIYMFGYSETSSIVDFIKEYGRINKNIKVELVDANDRKDLVSKYNIMTDDGMQTVLIVAGEKSKTYITVPSSSYSAGYSDFYTYDYTTEETTDITEERMTNGIIALSSVGESTPVYMLSGHGEYTAAREMALVQSYLTLENYEIKDLDLLSEQKVPDDCTSLVIASPEKDCTDFEASAIKEYISRGGNILWLSDPLSAKEEIPNFKSILDIYGVNVRQDGVIFERDTSRMVMGGADMVIPTIIGGNEIVEGLSRVLLIDTGKLEFKENLDELNVIKTDLLMTSESSFFRTNLQETSLTPVEGEKQEASIVAAVLEKSNGDDEEKKSKLVVFANNLFATNSVIPSGNTQVPAIAFYQNKDLALNSIQKISKEKEEMAIRKTVSYTSYTATETQDMIIKIIIFGLPIIIILVGIVVWILRRRKK